MSADLDLILPLLPDGAAPLATAWLQTPGLTLRLNRRRSHRLGAFQRHRDGTMSIMMNLHQDAYAFLITLAHEVAHMQVALRYGNTVAPHGKEWKVACRGLMLEAVSIPGLPDDIRAVMLAIARLPKSTHFSDKAVSRVLMKYSPVHAGQALLCDLPDGVRFAMPNGKIYIKGERNRTRYRCKLDGTSRFYLITGTVPVHQVA
jgi:SprT protein